MTYRGLSRVFRGGMGTEQQYGSKLTDSRTTIQTIEGRRARLERYRQKLQEGKKDL
jgi:hypothetical protein